MLAPCIRQRADPAVSKHRKTLLNKTYQFSLSNERLSSLLPFAGSLAVCHRARLCPLRPHGPCRASAAATESAMKITRRMPLDVAPARIASSARAPAPRCTRPRSRRHQASAPWPSRNVGIEPMRPPIQRKRRAAQTDVAVLLGHVVRQERIVRKEIAAPFGTRLRLRASACARTPTRPACSARGTPRGESMTA